MNDFLPKNGLSRAQELLPFLPFGKATLWSWSKRGKFPAPIKISPTITAWRNEEVWEWLRERGLSGASNQTTTLCNANQNTQPDIEFVNAKELVGFVEQEKLKLASKIQIIESSVGFSQITGVYFLIKETEIVYIGQSINCPKRIAEHTKDKDFDNFTIIKCERDELDILESLYIFKFEPKLNKVFTGSRNLEAKFTPLKVAEIISKCKKVT